MTGEQAALDLRRAMEGLSAVTEYTAVGGLMPGRSYLYPCCQAATLLPSWRLEGAQVGAEVMWQCGFGQQRSRNQRAQPGQRRPCGGLFLAVV